MPLHEWETFYMIVGPSAAALTGLQFVVMALSAQSNVPRNTGAVQAFATPTIVHLCSVLTIAALVVVPGHTAISFATSLVVIGVFGLIYGIVILRRTHRQTGYVPVLEDWLWHVGFPFLAYGALCLTGIAAYAHLAGALYFVAAVAVLLLFVGIHNAWDSAVYISTHGE